MGYFRSLVYGIIGFNLRREANPLATPHRSSNTLSPLAFQSQARSQSPGDNNLSALPVDYQEVSISGEKPIPWRQHLQRSNRRQQQSFNLRREANPLATPISFHISMSSRRFQSQARSQSPGDSSYCSGCTSAVSVSISGEKPIPWRQSSTPPMTSIAAKFQSQARSQSPGDLLDVGEWDQCNFVSISGEKPIPWRQGYLAHLGPERVSFNLRREANPLATWSLALSQCQMPCFNLRREANPLATMTVAQVAFVVNKFQSQARSQSPGDQGYQ